MRIITKYLLKELIGPFVYSLSGIIFIFILNVAFRDLGRLLGKGLPALIIFEFFFFNIAWIVALAIPMAMLIATLSTFGRLSQDNEITALKASGTNLYKLIFPVVVVSAILAFGLERFNNLVLPEFNYRASLLMSDISRKRPTISLEPNVFFDEIPNYSIWVHKIDERTNKLEGIIIFDTSDPKKNRTIVAKTGELHYSESNDRMILELFDGEIHETDRDHLQNYQRYLFARQTFSFSLENMTLKRSTEKHRGDREKNTRMMKADIADYRQRILDRENRIRLIMKENIESLFPEAWQSDHDSTKTVPMFPVSQAPKQKISRLLHQTESEINILDSYHRSIRSLQVEIEKKISIPVACIVFVLIGAPLGIMAHQGGMMAWVVSLIFFLIYWSCLIGGEQLADRGFIHPWAAMWGANIIVGGLGIYLVIRTVRETTFIQWGRLNVFKKLMMRMKKK